MEAYEMTFLFMCLYITPYFFVFHAVRVVSMEIRRLVLPRTSFFIYGTKLTVSCCSLRNTEVYLIKQITSESTM
jgi:hypothetical protein